MVIETIKIFCDNELGFRIINLEDYDPNVDTKLSEVDEVKVVPKQSRKKVIE